MWRIFPKFDTRSHFTDVCHAALNVTAWTNTLFKKCTNKPPATHSLLIIFSLQAFRKQIGSCWPSTGDYYLLCGVWVGVSHTALLSLQVCVSKTTPISVSIHFVQVWSLFYFTGEKNNNKKHLLVTWLCLVSLYTVVTVNRPEQKCGKIWEWLI